MLPPEFRRLIVHTETTVGRYSNAVFEVDNTTGYLYVKDTETGYMKACYKKWEFVVHESDG